jgi:hypothetical protein
VSRYTRIACYSVYGAYYIVIFETTTLPTLLVVCLPSFSLKDIYYLEMEDAIFTLFVLRNHMEACRFGVSDQWEPFEREPF